MRPDTVGRQDGGIEPLVLAPGIQAWRLGTDYDIHVEPDVDPEDYDRVMIQLGLAERDDYEVAYIPETGVEIFRMPIQPPSPVVLPEPRPALRETLSRAAVTFEQYVMELAVRDIATAVSVLLGR